MYIMLVAFIHEGGLIHDGGLTYRHIIIREYMCRLWYNGGIAHECVWL